MMQTNMSKEEQSSYMKIIGNAFEFRTISSKRRDLKQDLTFLGYKFFPVENNKSLLMGIYKRKNSMK